MKIPVYDVSARACDTCGLYLGNHQLAGPSQDSAFSNFDNRMCISCVRKYDKQRGNCIWLCDEIGEIPEIIVLGRIL